MINQPIEQMMLLQRGKEASFLDKQMSPLFDERRKQIVESMKVDYRSGNSTETSLKVAVGMLCAMDDLQNTLSRHINQGNRIQVQINLTTKGENDK